MSSTGIVVGTVFTGAVLVLAAACSSSTTGSSSGTSGTGTTPGTSGTGTSGTSESNSLDKCAGSSTVGTCTSADMKPYSDCVLAKCESKYTECYGANWKTGTYAGPCGSYMTCINACACEDTTCYSKCAEPTAECSTCLQGAATCSSSCTPPACASAGSSGGGGNGTTKTCAQLQACCNAKADADAKTQCLQTYDSLKANGDASCNALYGTMCP